MEDFGISPPQGGRGEAASWSHRHCEEEEYMEGVRRGVLGGAYVEELRRSLLDIKEERRVAAMGTQGDAAGNLARPRGRRSWSPKMRTLPYGKTSRTSGPPCTIETP